MRRLPIFLSLLGLTFILANPSIAAQQTGDPDHDWCQRQHDHDGDRRERYCEVRSLSAIPQGVIDVDARINGGIAIESWDRNEIQITAKVQAWVDQGDDPEALVRQIEVQTGPIIRADGPRRSARSRRSGWSVSYRVMVPEDSDLSLRAHNGGISVEGVSGNIETRTLNGGVSLRDVQGDVRARTTNGGVTVELSGDTWQGSGLDVETTNGGVTLTVPDDFRADLTTGTVNGGLEIDFPITVQGRLNRRRVRTELNGGGPPVRVVTTNGSVSIRRR